MKWTVRYFAVLAFFTGSSFSWAHGRATTDQFRIDEFGAIGDGRTLCTRFIQAAIDSCHARGGGTVVVPAGRFLTATICLRSGVYLRLEPGAVLLGSRNYTDYDTIASALVYAEDAEDLGIVGQGIINGQGDAFWRGKKRPFRRPGRTIRFVRCRNAEICGIRIENSAAFNVALEECDGVSVRDVRIVNDRDAPNTDGIDPISSSNVFISNCYIDTGDDAICLKSQSKQKACENVVVTNCVLISDDTGIKCGTSSHGVIQKCVFSNIVIRNTQYGIGLYMKDGGVYQDLQFDNVIIETTVPRLYPPRRAAYPIFMDIESRDEAPFGTIRNIRLSHITIHTVHGNCLIAGMPEKPIENVQLEDVVMRVERRPDFSKRKKPRGNRKLKSPAPNDYAWVSAHLTVAHVRDFVVKDLRIEDLDRNSAFERHLIWAKDVEGGLIEGLFNFQTRYNRQMPLLHLMECRDVTIRSCRPVGPEVPFVAVEGAGSERIRLVANDASRCGQSVRKGTGVESDAVRVVSELR